VSDAHLLEPVDLSLFSERRAMDNWPHELLADEAELHRDPTIAAAA
jgi:hypothetical protein